MDVVSRMLLRAAPSDQCPPARRTLVTVARVAPATPARQAGANAGIFCLRQKNNFTITTPSPNQEPSPGTLPTSNSPPLHVSRHQPTRAPPPDQCGLRPRPTAARSACAYAFGPPAPEWLLQAARSALLSPPVCPALNVRARHWGGMFAPLIFGSLRSGRSAHRPASASRPLSGSLRSVVLLVANSPRRARLRLPGYWFASLN
jgi:hypothetical protein